MENHPIQEKWEEEFDEKFPSVRFGLPFDSIEESRKFKESVKEFIRSLLTTYRTSLIGEIEKERWSGHGTNYGSHNLSIDHILTLLQSQDKEVCDHALDKNRNFCMKCGMKVVAKTFTPITKEEEKCCEKCREDEQHLCKGTCPCHSNK